MSAVPIGWGITREFQRVLPKKCHTEMKARDIAGDLVEWVLANRVIPSREAIADRFDVSKATAYRWRAWLEQRFAGRL